MEKPLADNERPNPTNITSDLQQSFQKALDQQRALWEKLTEITKDETFRFAKLRLDRTNDMLAKLQDSDGPSEIMSGQQDWLRGLITDYAAQSVRYSEMLRSLATNAFLSSASAGRDTMKRAQEVMREAEISADKNANATQDSAEASGQSGQAAETEQPTQDIR